MSGRRAFQGEGLGEYKGPVVGKVRNLYGVSKGRRLRGEIEKEARQCGPRRRLLRL